MSRSLKIVTQNCFLCMRVRKVRRLIQENPSDFYCFQEITNREIGLRLNGNPDLSHIFSKDFYTANKLVGARFGNLTFSRLPITKTGELDFEIKAKNRFSGKALWVETEHNEIGKIKIYNCYLRVDSQGMKERSLILSNILEDALKFKGPVVICGDMNTSIPDPKNFRKLVQWFQDAPDPDPVILGDYAFKNERYLFYDTAAKYGFKETADLELNTWRIPFLPPIEAFKLKLDWMLYKGFSKSTYKLGPWIGDHRSIIAEFTV